MPTLCGSKPVGCVRQGPLPNAIQPAWPAEFGFAGRKGRNLTESRGTKTKDGDIDKAHERKMPHDNFPRADASSNVVTQEQTRISSSAVRSRNAQRASIAANNIANNIMALN